jgi:ubiquinone/menaquinone biosynthesis C-methylase UbiE
MLKQTFPNAEVIGLDLSPYMLVRASHKSNSSGLDINWQYGNAENTIFTDSYFDLITISFLFHEIPLLTSQAIINETFRLLVNGGEIVILDGNQRNLHQLEWLTDMFEEPYIKQYGSGCMETWMGTTGFAKVKTHSIWWVYQLTSGIKPMIAKDDKLLTYKHHYISTYTDSTTNDTLQGFPSPA